jgi:AraC-like DNA-binding protein
MRASILQDSLTVRERDSKAAEYEIRFKTQEVQLALQKKEAKERLQWIMIAALVLILLISGIALWRNIVAKRQLRKVNHDLYDTIQQMLEQEKKAEEALEGIPVSALSGTQQLYQRIVKLMQEQKPYTDSAMNRDTLAHMMGTNYNLVADAIRECAGGQTIGEFIDDWRLRHAAEMLAHTDEPIGLIVEMSGFKSRSHFNTLFRERFKLTPSEYIRLKK